MWEELLRRTDSGSLWVLSYNEQQVNNTFPGWYTELYVLCSPLYTKVANNKQAELLCNKLDWTLEMSLIDYGFIHSYHKHY